ncbi:MAG: methylenetetrahydrofolate reductase [NAD(P)H] [Robiginitomaculum sp.]
MPTTHTHLSFEFFPPKTDKGAKRLWNCVKALSPYAPKFVSVTYGAGGSTRERTHEAVARIASDTPLSTAAHLTCVGSPRDEIDTIADAYWNAGVHHIVALRGDPPAGIDAAYAPTKGGYAYSCDLVAGLKALHDFEVSVSAYPERHPESPSWDIEIDNLKRKVDLGADRAITQFFFKSETFIKFLERARAAGITIPIVPGIMLQPKFSGLARMSKMCGVDVPDDIAAQFTPLENDEAGRKALTTALALEQITVLKTAGVNDFHLYTLNRSDIASEIATNLQA